MTASRWSYHLHHTTRLADVYEVSSGTIYATDVRMRDVLSTYAELDRKYPAVAGGVAPVLTQRQVAKREIREGQGR